jgi:hypothetical protein
VSKARKRLAEVDERLTNIAQQERDLATRYAAAKQNVEDLHGELVGAHERGAIGTDGSTTDDDVKKVHGDLAAALAVAESARWDAEAEGLRRAKQKLEGERTKLANEHFHELAAELVLEATSIRTELDEAVNVVAAVARKWNAIGQAWLSLERAADISRHTRLDIPKFPFDVVNDIDALPIPPILNPDRDPTLRSAA